MNERGCGNLTRREFIAGATATAAALAAVGKATRPASAAKGDLTFASGTRVAEAIRNKEISSLELTDLMISRIEKHDKDINAVVVRVFDQARARAKEADAALAKGETWGPFHGVPATMKESYDLEGQITTAGVPALKDNRATADAEATRRMKNAGAIILGKTNVPFMLTDIQSYNAIYGTTNNPWDLTRTPGGSTGGGAASLAAGFNYLVAGSDIGGSIRTPSHFCGVYGHKPTIEVVSKLGHVPPMPGDAALPSELSVSGPLTRSAEDLMAMMKVLGGPAGYDARAYSWQMPAPRKKSLKEYKVGYMIDDSFCPVVPEQKAVLQNAISALEKTGVTVAEGWPKGVNPVEQIENYLFMLIAALPPLPPVAANVYDDYAKALGHPVPINVPEIVARASAASHRDYQAAQNKRWFAREAWEAFFKDFDVFLMPTGFVNAFPHDQSFQMARTLKTSLGDRPYFDLLSWISFATMTGNPATVAPVGLTSEGLPTGMQILGPYLEDATTIDFAAKMAEVVGGFTPPPKYAV